MQWPWPAFVQQTKPTIDELMWMEGMGELEVRNSKTGEHYVYFPISMIVIEERDLYFAWSCKDRKLVLVSIERVS